MDYIPVTEDQRREMLASLGASSIQELFRDLPQDLPFPVLGNGFPEGKTELELTPLLQGLAAKNVDQDQVLSFLGGGAYPHYIPSAVSALASRSEFATAYTPYQPEVSQGTLQAIFEFQSLVAALAELPVANASLYDGGSALAEGVLMATRVTKRAKVLVAQTLHPHYLEVVRTYLGDLPIQVDVVPFREDGTIDLKTLDGWFSEEIACVALSHPNFFGCLEDVRNIAEKVHAVGGLLVVNSLPFTLGVLQGPGGLGADIVTMEGQSIGNELLYGGPYVGLFACREAYARFIPGRVVGETVDQAGRKGYVLTLQTREQHIRREKATSNICTNQALAALQVLIYLSLVGRDGLRKRGLLCLQKAAYLKAEIAKLRGFRIPFSAPTFSEFVVESDPPFSDLEKVLVAQHVFPGLGLPPYFPYLAGFENRFLVSVTELHTRADLDRFVTLLAAAKNRLD